MPRFELLSAFTTVQRFSRRQMKLPRPLSKPTTPRNVPESSPGPNRGRDPLRQNRGVPLSMVASSQTRPVGKRRIGSFWKKRAQKSFQGTRVELSCHMAATRKRPVTELPPSVACRRRALRPIRGTTPSPGARPTALRRRPPNTPFAHARSVVGRAHCRDP